MDKKDPTMCCLQEIHFKYKDTNKLKVKGWRKLSHANTNQKETEIAILIQAKQTSEQGNVSGIKRRHSIMLKGSILQEDIGLNVYALTEHQNT